MTGDTMRVTFARSQGSEQMAEFQSPREAKDVCVGVAFLGDQACQEGACNRRAGAFGAFEVDLADFQRVYDVNVGL